MNSTAGLSVTGTDGKMFTLAFQGHGIPNLDPTPDRSSFPLQVTQVTAVSDALPTEVALHVDSRYLSTSIDSLRRSFAYIQERGAMRFQLRPMKLKSKLPS